MRQAFPEACEAAVANSGEPATVVIEAARFYLQQALFRPEADSYRVLGIDPGASRATARNHMRWLLEWLHPDRNNNSWDAVYAERVLKAWREVSASQGSAVKLWSLAPMAHPAWRTGKISRRFGCPGSRAPLSGDHRPCEG